MEASLDSSFITVEIGGPGVDVAMLTRELGVTPTWAHDPAARPDEDGGGAPGWGYWALNTRGHVTGNRLADHLRWLADRLAPAEGTLRRLASAGTARLLIQGAPETWVRDPATDEQERLRLGLSLAFVAFLKGSPQLNVGNVKLRERGDEPLRDDG